MKTKYIKQLKILIKIILSILIFMSVVYLGSSVLFGQTTYYSTGSVNPNTLANWNTSRTGGGSSPANFTSNNVYYVIQNGHNMTTSANWTVSGTNTKVQIENGGSLTGSHTINLSTTTTFRIDDGGTYTHNTNAADPASNIFNGIESFGNSSNFIVKDWQNLSSGTPPAIPAGISFGNLTIDITTALQWIQNGNLTTINGNLYIKTINNGGSFRLTNNTSFTLNIGGNLTIENGNLICSNNNIANTLNIAGNFSVNGNGVLFYLNGTTVNLSGDFTLTKGTVARSGGNCTFNFVKAGIQTYTKAAGTTISNNSLTFVVNSGSTLNMGTSLFDGTSNFTLSSGATLGVSHSNGVLGNITTSGTKTFSSGANYIFNGTAAQVISTFTTSPTANTINSLTIDNTYGVTLSRTISIAGTTNALTLTHGNLLLSTFDLLLSDNSATVAGSFSNANMVVTNSTGRLGKYFNTGNTAAFTFPIGDTTGTPNYSPVTVDFSANANAGSVYVNVIDNVHPNINTSGNPTTGNYVSRYWSFKTSGLTGNYTYDITYNYANEDVQGYIEDMILQRYNAGWNTITPTTINSTTLTKTGLTQATGPFATGNAYAIYSVPRSTITAGASAEPATISSTIDTQGEAVLNFDFTYIDDGGSNNDINPTKISKIVINQGTGNTITDWSQAISGAILTDGTETQTSNVAINATNITFSSIPNDVGNLGYIADGASKTYTLKIWLKSSLGGTLLTTIDGLRFVFLIDYTGLTLVGGNGLPITQTTNSGNTKNAVSVIASNLIFTTQPSSTALLNTNLAQQPVVEAVDVNGNRDLGYSSTITLSNTGGLNMTGNSIAAASGVATYTALKFTTGNNYVFLNAGDGTLNSSTPSIEIAVSIQGCTIFSENFESLATGNLQTTGSGWLTIVNTASVNIWAIGDNSGGDGALNGNRGLTITNGTYANYTATDDADVIAYNTTLIDASNYTNLQMDFNWKCSGESGLDYGTIVWSSDKVTWYTLGTTTYLGQATTQNVTNLDLSILNGRQFYIGFRWVNDASTRTNPPFVVDDISIRGIPNIDMEFSSSNGSFTQITDGTTASLDGNSGCNIILPFTFNYLNTNYTNARISKNGWLELGQVYTGVGNTNNLSTTATSPFLAPLWDDLVTDGSTSILYLTTGTQPNRVFTVEWRNILWEEQDKTFR